MRTFNLLFATLGIAFLTSMTPAGGDPNEHTGISFTSGTWEELLTKAKEENKVVFIDAYAVWCGPCKMLSRNVFTDEQVGAYFNENFINAKIDMEKGEGPMLARKFGVTAYPTLIFAKPDGSIVHKAIGYHNPQQLIAVGQQVISKTSN
ncbi:MAG: thioredoxin domain-containing protein [Flavobacteriales bacterium]